MLCVHIKLQNMNDKAASNMAAVACLISIPICRCNGKHKFQLHKLTRCCSNEAIKATVAGGKTCLNGRLTGAQASVQERVRTSDHADFLQGTVRLMQQFQSCQADRRTNQAHYGAG